MRIQSAISAEKHDKNRKIYNGMIKTYFYQFMGPKPPRRKRISRVYEIFKEIYCIYIYLGTYLCV